MTAQENAPAAQPEGQTADRERSGATLLAEILVTGTKQNKEQLNQTVPVAITAVGGEQIEALKNGDFTEIVPGAQCDSNARPSPSEGDTLSS